MLHPLTARAGHDNWAGLKAHLCLETWKEWSWCQEDVRHASAGIKVNNTNGQESWKLVENQISPLSLEGSDWFSFLCIRSSSNKSIRVYLLIHVWWCECFLQMLQSCITIVKTTSKQPCQCCQISLEKQETLSNKINLNEWHRDLGKWLKQVGVFENCY